ncbi:MAG: Holliday junction branch migration protein RuvA [Actinobacteria bacterium]|nr:MAG: Holliday junction branch migration protein RuvA [Actinomycetota bacterium]
MIGAVSGTVVETYPDGALVDVNGVGYRVHAPASVLARLPGAGERVRLYTHLHVREEALTLFGFITTEERDLFEVLIGVNGIGPKGGLAVLSVYAPDALRRAIIGEDVDALTLIPGVGKKTASRMILELKEKLDAGDADLAPLAGSPAVRQALSEVRAALIQLGYSTTEAREAIERVSAEAAAANGNGTAEALLKKALKELGAR